MAPLMAITGGLRNGEVMGRKKGETSAGSSAPVTPEPRSHSLQSRARATGSGRCSASWARWRAARAPWRLRGWGRRGSGGRRGRWGTPASERRGGGVGGGGSLVKWALAGPARFRVSKFFSFLFQNVNKYILKILNKFIIIIPKLFITKIFIFGPIIIILFNWIFVKKKISTKHPKSNMNKTKNYSRCKIKIKH
jgi:hypothetical protein